MGYIPDGYNLWPLLPNWKNSVLESLEFKTELLRALTGVSQIRKLRDVPRRTFEFSILAHHKAKRLYDNMIADKGGSQWQLPIWHDVQRLAATLAAGSTVIPCITDGVDFSTLAVLYRGLNDFEVVQIDTIEPGQLTLSSATISEWPARTKLYPLRAALLDPVVTGSERTSTVHTDTVSLTIDEACDWTAVAPASTYKTLPVWEIKPDRSGDRETGFSRDITLVDNGIGKPVRFDLPDTFFVSSSVRWLAKGRSEHAALRSLLYYLAGRAGVLWVPSWTADLKPVAGVTAVQTTLDVEWSGYTLFGRQQANRRDLRIPLANGSVLYRRVIGSVDHGSYETLTLDSALGVAVSLASFGTISFMSLAQGASDRVEIEHLTSAAGVSAVTMAFQGVKAYPGEGSF